MEKMIKIRIKDFYREPVGEMEYIDVSGEVYEILAHTFRRESHAQKMRDFRHRAGGGYVEGDTEGLLAVKRESLEDMVIRRMELARLEKAVQSLSEVQRERLHLYFFQEKTMREIAKLQGISRNAVWQSLQVILKRMRCFFPESP